MEVVRISDPCPRIPLDDQSVNDVHCGGVLPHTSAPDRILREWDRVLRPRSQARIMVDNRHSLWFHLDTACDKMILQDAFPA